ncbi:MAG: hypothetical protein ACI9MR_001746 [Myxococcota bacterium]|jgi:hypothetical protein
MPTRYHSRQTPAFHVAARLVWALSISALVAAVLLSLLLPTSAAHAEVDEFAVSVGPALWLSSATPTFADDSQLEVTSVAPAVHLGLRYGLTDFWQIGGSIGGGLALSGDHDPSFVGYAHTEAYYFLDALTWVVYGVAGVGVLARGQHPDVLVGTADGLRFDLSAALGAGLDYRPARDWSVGGAFRYHLVLTDFERTAPQFELAFTYTSYFE